MITFLGTGEVMSGQCLPEVNLLQGLLGQLVKCQPLLNWGCVCGTSLRVWACDIILDVCLLPRHVDNAGPGHLREAALQPGLKLLVYGSGVLSSEVAASTNSINSVIGSLEVFPCHHPRHGPRVQPVNTIIIRISIRVFIVPGPQDLSR